MVGIISGRFGAALITALFAFTALPYAADAQTSSGASDRANAVSQEDGTNVFTDEIVVTARKRQELAQSIPMAISAFSGEAIEARGVQKIDGVASFTPNLTFQNNPGFGGAGSSAAIYIRGIGQKEFLPTTEPGVGVYVDGVYIARSVGALLDLVDIERVEILRGPQGTLFGRNTIGGAISITSRKPDGIRTGAFRQRPAISAGSMSKRWPICRSLTVLFKVAVAWFNRDGYVRHLVDGRDLGDVNTLTGRLDLRWLATDNLEVNLAVEGTRDRSNGPAFVLADVDYSSRC